MTQEELKKQLSDRGFTQEELAEEYGCSSAFVTRFFKNKSFSEKFETFCLRKLGIAT